MLQKEVLGDFEWKGDYRGHFYQKNFSSFKNDAEKHAEMKEKYELIHIADSVLNLKKGNICSIKIYAVTYVCIVKFCYLPKKVLICRFYVEGYSLSLLTSMTCWEGTYGNDFWFTGPLKIHACDHSISIGCLNFPNIIKSTAINWWITV